jgi:hypothetical protein
VATKAKASDFTGRQRDAAAALAAEEQNKAAQAQAAASAEAAYKAENEVVDATKPNAAFAVVVDEIKSAAPKGEKTVTIRVAEDIESMTLGAGNYYSFKTGQKYDVTQDVADHLEAKGYLAARL